MNRFVTSLLLALLAAALLAAPALAADKVLMMATTTSTDNTGLLDYLKPHFEKQTGIEWRWTAVGTGKALKLGENCDVDIVMVHAPAAEMEYVNKGVYVNRKQVMYNDFVIIGPAGDPAKIRGKSVVDALEAVRNGKAVFVSRGDNSGTNKKEISLWKATGSVPEKQSWYVQTGQGMLTTIGVAAERGGYTMTDRGTYIKYEADKKGNPPLKILVEGDRILLNQYSVMAVNPEKCPSVQYGPAMVFIRWITDSRAQKLIGDFKLMNKKLFTANAE